MLPHALIIRFRQQLLQWHASCPRPMPWKGLRDPYLIWLAEVILQQTRVTQGWPWFERFRKRFPTVQHLAAATEDEVLKLWEGLGYYTRARNLWRTARYVVEQLDGQFPRNYEGLLKLKGIGPYTAAAIASFAWRLPHAVVDGNVLRVLARFLADDTPIDSGPGKRHFTQLAQTLLDPQYPDSFNQAIMDLGATVCTPHNPQCHKCPLHSDCRATRQGIAPLLPVKRRKTKVRTRHLHYLIWTDGQHTLLQRRPSGDIWAALYDFPFVETSHPTTSGQQLLRQWLHAHQLAEPRSLPHPTLLWQGRQRLTHQLICGYYWWVLTHQLPPTLHNWQYVTIENLCKFALPKLTGNFYTYLLNFKDSLPTGKSSGIYNP